ncbi:DUF2946 family protein [Ruegeria arenilitoris]|uniref:DUF2946 family protein n=1 Tax=Ruegeria arenilitoris TaxID=1173585 RepID=UPI0020C53013|nr:DUF2946 family protein [Ruegeria arenilitoris]
MPAARQNHSLPVRAIRVAPGLAGILLLMLQVLGPALASPGQGTWMEICSEAGAVWVQVDLEGDTGDPTAACPKCADCALCAITAAAPVPDLPQVQQPGFVQITRCECADLLDSYSSERLWPETRGPPAAPEIRTERAPRASMASTRTEGGAPWS